MKIIIFEINDERYALPTEQVLEVVNLLPATAVPFSPAYVTGLINRAGQIMPRIDLALKLGRANGVAAQGVLLVALVQGVPHAFHISRVVAMAAVGEEALQRFNGAEVVPDRAGSLVRGMIQWEEDMVWLLDAASLGLEQAGCPSQRAVPPGPLGREESREVPAGLGRGELLSYLVIKVGGELQALPLDQVERVMNVESITDLPQAPWEVSGMVCLRGGGCLAISLLALQGRGAGRGESVMVVVERDGLRLALLIQEVVGIARFAPTERQEMGEGQQACDGYFLNEDRCLIALIRLEGLLPEERLARYRCYLGPRTDGNEGRPAVCTAA